MYLVQVSLLLIFKFPLMRIRILLLIKVMRICDHWSTDRPFLSLHASILSIHGLSWLHFEPLKLLNFDFNAGPDPDPQPWYSTQKF